MLLGGVALLCFLPADSAPVDGLSGWQMNVAGMLGLVALFIWQRRNPAARLAQT